MDKAFVSVISYAPEIVAAISRPLKLSSCLHLCSNPGTLKYT
jgi:hypothetical protein